MDYNQLRHLVSISHPESINGAVTLKQRSKDYYAERIAALRNSWPDLEKTDIRKVTKVDCMNWGASFGHGASPTAYNNTVKVLRDVLTIGMESGARYDNPALSIKRASLRAKKLKLPEFDVTGGMKTKNGEFRSIPMIRDMVQLLDRLRPERHDELPETPVMRVRECQKAMDRAAKIVGMPRITHHDLRHLFATRCIESGVHIPTVSRWLGHKDGGALAMKVYGHLRHQHSVEMAQKVTFARPQETENGSNTPAANTPSISGNS